VDQRLLGEPPSDRLLSPRLPAAVAAGVLAASTAAPAAAVSAVSAPAPDDVSAQAVEQHDDAQRSDFDPGGPPASLPDVPADPPNSPVDSDHAQADVVDGEPTDDVVETVADDGDQSAAEDASPAATSPPSQPVPPTQVPETPPSAPDALDVAVSAPATSPPPTPSVVESTGNAVRVVSPLSTQRKRSDRTPSLHRTQQNLQGSARGVLASRSRAVQTLVAASNYVAVRSVRRAGVLKRAVALRWYVVRTGDSLWGIAARLLGYDPATENPESLARIKTEVDRLWKLNHSRLRSADPSLIYAGEGLRLR
jgi:hypothetical protein